MRQTFDGEKVHFNLARLKKGGKAFELVINPDLAIDYKHGKEVDMRELLKAEQVFFDAKKGDIASEHLMQETFGTSDPLKVADIILKEGEIQLTEEYRERLKEEKRKKIIAIIHLNGVDPKTGLPHPPQRLENAFSEAKIHIDLWKKPEDQVQDILQKIRPVLPISFETKEVEIHVPSEYAAKLYSTVKGYGKILKDNWMNDGSWLCVVEIAAGLQADFFDELNNKTHGNVEAKILKTK
ncbi:MAG: ribosome assembly factor SBDS [archaeon]